MSTDPFDAIRRPDWDGCNHSFTPQPAPGHPYCDICGGTRAGFQHLATPDLYSPTRDPGADDG